MTITTSTPTTASTRITPADLPAVDGQGAGNERLSVVGRAPGWARWAVVCCAGLIAVGVTATVVTHRSTAASSPVPSAVTIGSLDPGAASSGREWEQRALTSGEAPARGRIAAASGAIGGAATVSDANDGARVMSAADLAAARLRAGDDGVAAAQRDGQGTGHGRVLMRS